MNSKVELCQGPLAPGQVSQVQALAQAANQADGVAPLGEASLLALHQVGTCHLMLHTHAGTLAGYAGVSATTIELVVAPTYRRQALGTALATAAFQLAPHARAWAHGNLPGAVALAASLHLEPCRELLHLSAPVPAPAPPRPLPAGVQVRAFTDADADAWVQLNAQIFATHPEQGHLTRADLDDRRRQDWWDPTAFLVAVQAGQLVGYVWSKILADDGEIYVIGVAPTWQGQHLGEALLTRAFALFNERKLVTMSLYVEGDNPARRLYTRLGFEIATAHVQYARRIEGSQS